MLFSKSYLDFLLFSKKKNYYKSQFVFGLKPAPIPIRPNPVRPVSSLLAQLPPQPAPLLSPRARVADPTCQPRPRHARLARSRARLADSWDPLATSSSSSTRTQESVSKPLRRLAVSNADSPLPWLLKAAAASKRPHHLASSETLGRPLSRAAVLTNPAFGVFLRPQLRRARSSPPEPIKPRCRFRRVRNDEVYLPVTLASSEAHRTPSFVGPEISPPPKPRHRPPWSSSSNREPTPEFPVSPSTSP